MNKIEPSKPKNWLALHEEAAVRELTLQLCAEGNTDLQVAQHLRESGLVMQCTQEDIKYYRTANAPEIAAYIEKNSKALFGKIARTKKAYRVGELDKLLGLLIEKIPAWLDAKPNIAAQLMKVYLQGSQQLAVETGDLMGATEPKNQWIEMLQQANPEQKEAIMKALLELDTVSKQIGTKKLPDPHVIDAEFESSEA